MRPCLPRSSGTSSAWRPASPSPPASKEFRDRDAHTAARAGRPQLPHRDVPNYATMRFLKVWYSRIDIDEVTSLFDAVQPKKAVRRRRQRHRQRAPPAHQPEGVPEDVRQGRRAVPHPARPSGDRPLPRSSATPASLAELRHAIALYQETLAADRREVLRRYYFGDFARKVVGVGSVGTEAFILLLLGDRPDEPLFLQLKEAQESVLAPFAGKSEYAHQGERVVKGQLLTQAASDPFLGWTSGIGTSGTGSSGDGHEPACGQGLLRAPAARHEGQHERLPDGPAPAQLLRQALRLGAGPRARPDRAGNRDLRLPGRRRGLRPRRRRLRRSPTPTRTSRTTGGCSRPSPTRACWRPSANEFTHPG